MMFSFDYFIGRFLKEDLPNLLASTAQVFFSSLIVFQTVLVLTAILLRKGGMIFSRFTF